MLRRAHFHQDLISPVQSQTVCVKMKRLILSPIRFAFSVRYLMRIKCNKLLDLNQCYENSARNPFHKDANDISPDNAVEIGEP